MRWRNIILIVVGTVVAAPITAIGIFIATFSVNDWKPRIQEAVMRATGRELSLRGPISQKWSLVPTIEAHDVALANIDGGSQPQMMTAQRIRADVALLPLLSNRIEISRLVVTKPDILVETTQDSRGNWVFPKPAAPNATPERAAAPGKSMNIEFNSVRIDDGTLTWRNGVTGRRVTVALNSFELLEPSETSPVTFELVARYAGTRFEANGETGPTARLRDTAMKMPWPVKLTVSLNGAQLLVEGQSTTPLQPASFSGQVSGKLVDLAQLAPFLPRTKLPSVKGVSFSATVGNSGPPLMRITDVALNAGPTDLSAYAPGLSLAHVDIRSPRMDQPVTVQAEGSYAEAPLKISATLGAVSALIGREALTVDVSLAVAGAIATAKGTVADPERPDGTELVVSVRIPTVVPFAALVQQPVPDLKNIVFDAYLAELQGGFAKGIALTQARLSLPQSDVAGEASVTSTWPPSITGSVTSKRIDLDALLNVKSVNPPAPAEQQTAPASATPGPLPERRGNPNVLFSNVPFDLSDLS